MLDDTGQRGRKEGVRTWCLQTGSSNGLHGFTNSVIKKNLMWPCKWKMQLKPSWLQHSKCGYDWERSPILQFSVTFQSSIESIFYQYLKSLNFTIIHFLSDDYFFYLNILLWSECASRRSFQHTNPLEVYLRCTSVHRQNIDRKAWNHRTCKGNIWSDIEVLWTCHC